MKKAAPTPASKSPGNSNRGPGQVRLIGGRWRGSKLAVGNVAGLRPTSDRVRETLFNWLSPMLSGARVLDLFAGSGALGLEAVSRGAASAVLVERDPGLAVTLFDATVRLAGGDAVTVIRSDALAWLPTQPRASFDLAFLDPPFSAGLWDQVLPALMPLLAADAWIYIEAPLAEQVSLPEGWSLHRDGRTREARYALYRRLPTPGQALADTLGVDPAGVDARPNEPTTE